MARAAALSIVCFAALAAAPAVAQSEREPDLSYVVVDGLSIPDALTEQPGVPARGAEVFASAEAGDCGSCHKIGGAGGEAGPALDDVGRRLSASAIRLWVVNPGVLKDDSGMPAYYTLAPEKPGDPKRTEPPLSAQQVEDLVAYLDSLKSAPPSAGGGN